MQPCMTGDHHRLLAPHESMDLGKYPLDLMLVPLSLCLTAGYHAFIWYNSNGKHPSTAIGVTMMRRNIWLQDIVQEDSEKKRMLGVQSLRNAMMSAILSATIAISINSALAALVNNTYNSKHLLQYVVFGSQAGSMLALKFASASLLLLFSFLCSSVAVGYMVEANFLVGAGSSGAEGELLEGHVREVLKRGWVLSIVGNRVLLTTFPFLLWLLGPVPLAMSSVAMVFIFYSQDF